MSNNSLIAGNVGVAAVERAILNAGSVYNRLPNDIGIDGQVEIFREGISTGRLIGVQVTSGSSFFRYENCDGILFRAPTSSFDYWLRYELPVIIALHNPADDAIYWEVVAENTITTAGKTSTIRVPRTNRLERSAIATLERFVKRKEPTKVLPTQNHGAAGQVDTFAVSPGRVVFRGSNLERAARIEVNGVSAEILQASDTFVEARLPEEFVGEVQLHGPDAVIAEFRCDSRVRGVYEGLSEIIETDLPLFSDALGLTPRSAHVGLLLRVFQGGRYYRQIVPTDGRKHHKGSFFITAIYDMTNVVGETWYRKPSGKLLYAWTSAAVAIPKIVEGSPRLSAFQALPSDFSLGIGEVRTLTARGIESLGTGRREIDLSAEAVWSSDDSSIAYVDNDAVRGIAFGSTTLRCHAKGFESSQSVDVLTLPQGQLSTFFEGLRPVAQISIDEEDNLYLSNKTPVVYRVRPQGGVEKFFQVAAAEDLDFSIDYISARDGGEVYFTAPQPRQVMHYVKGAVRRIGPNDESVKRSVAIAPDGTVVVGIMGMRPQTGHVLQLRDGEPDRIFQARDSAHNLAVAEDGRIFVAAPSLRTIDVFNASGDLVDELSYDLEGGVGAIAVGRDLSVFVGLWSGYLLRLRKSKKGIDKTVLASGLGNPGGLAFDSKGRIFISDFGSGRVYVMQL